MKRSLIISAIALAATASCVSPRTDADLLCSNVNPNGFKRLTQKLVQKGIICKTEDGKYFKEV